MKCVLGLSGVVYGPIYGRFIGCTVNGFLSWGLQRSGPTDPPIHYVKKDQEGAYFSRNFVCILKTTTTFHMVSFIDFYFHFLAFSRPKLRPICSLYLFML